MSADWIEGRFVGVYSGPKRTSADLPAWRKKRSRTRALSEPRRFGFEIQSGHVYDLAIGRGPTSKVCDPDQTIRQQRVKRVRLEDERGEISNQETSLFDVEISDWELKHPAEADGHAYGTLVGTIRARRRPPAIVPPEPERVVAPSARESPRDVVESAVRVPESAPDSAEATARNYGGEVEQKSLGWSEVLLFLWVGFAAIAYTYGLRVALVWCAPIGAGLGSFWLTGGGLVRGVPRWLTSTLPMMQILVLWPAIMHAWQTGCWPTHGTVQMALIALPVVLAALARSRGGLCATAAIWTAVICLGHATPDADACLAAVDADTGAASRTQASDQPVRRTSEAGRWPVMPPWPGPRFVSSAEGATDSAQNEAAPTSSTMSDGPSGAGREDGRDSGATPLTPTASGGAEPTTADPEPSSAQDPGSRTAKRSRPDANPASPEDVARPSARALTPIEGGWLSPDHRRAPRELVLISIEQANRTPELFFEGGGAHRVYVPTDPIFEEASSSLRGEAPLVLARVAALLSLESQTRLLLDVHSDAAGAPENQVELTRRRAEIVRSWLVDRGHVSPERFEMRAVGGSRPLVPPDGDYAAQRPNRRIEIRLGEDG